MTRPRDAQGLAPDGAPPASPQQRHPPGHDPPHHPGPALGYLFEMTQVRREMPRHAAIFPDDSIGGAGEDKDDFGMIHDPALP